LYIRYNVSKENSFYGWDGQFDREYIPQFNKIQICHDDEKDEKKNIEEIKNNEEKEKIVIKEAKPNTENTEKKVVYEEKKKIYEEKKVIYQEKQTEPQN